MIKKLFPIVLPVLGLGLGTGAGLFLKPDAASPTEASADAKAEKDVAEGEGGATEGGGHAAAPEEKPTAEDHGSEAAGEDEKPEFVKLTNQFIVPLLQEGRVVSLVILSLNLQVEAGKSEEVYALEPKLRDAFLQVLFDHANAGGFRGSFTDGSNLLYLRRALLERAQGLVGPVVTDVLISDIARQDS